MCILFSDLQGQVAQLKHRVQAAEEERDIATTRETALREQVRLKDCRAWGKGLESPEKGRGVGKF